MSVFESLKSRSKISLRDLVRDQVLQEGSDSDCEQFEVFLGLVDKLGADPFREFKTVDEFLGWAKTGLSAWISSASIALAERDVAASAVGLPSESQKEDALSWVECTAFSGSEKQVKWAKSIASSDVAIEAIAVVLKKGGTLPTQARWWIDHRNGIGIAVLGLA